MENIKILPIAKGFFGKTRKKCTIFRHKLIAFKTTVVGDTFKLNKQAFIFSYRDGLKDWELSRVNARWQILPLPDPL